MKSKFYRINKLNDSTMLILSTSYHSPTEQLNSIEKELIKKKFEGKVLFDMLLSNGNSEQRFFETSFMNNVINLNNIINISNQVDEIKEASRRFYLKHFDLVENSHVLSNAAKFLLKQGRI
ncbi:MAG: hypothetical protein FP820_09945 [Sulfurimonas sp.]|nr:hypothetical protein [Sulfurimonas sp.]MBU3939598.1 type II toxin-antitoxin system RnlB family antitoxin [bacterium]MBU4003003.1 type II toxin-antitoxin system RnlB family antitoxin [Pseudomonadota bacterium]